MKLLVSPYLAQAAQWPARGRHILAQFDAETVVVYQAYRPSIGQFAAANNYFGGADFSFARMSWIKPNFLWMMYRCGWAAKEGQEVVLAITLARTAFDQILAAAVPSSYDERRYADRAAWAEAVKTSDVRLQWDPDHDPHGRPVERRAIQLGLRGSVLENYARPWIRGIEDITPFVRDQHARLQRGGPSELVTPSEHVYPCEAATAAALGLDAA
ncbi:MAG: DUF4291 domain-containing protein [Kofleriaceae bacterium]|nr:DUF4291 domain-containing protein [Kofleriaceae bacterium]